MPFLSDNKDANGTFDCGRFLFLEAIFYSFLLVTNPTSTDCRGILLASKLLKLSVQERPCHRSFFQSSREENYAANWNE